MATVTARAARAAEAGDAAGGGSPGRTVAYRVRRLAYGAFSYLPPRLRHRIVRLLVPGYGIGAVALVRDSEQPSRLLLLRAPRTVGWSLPGGILRRGEPPVQGCARELAEEAGISLDPAQLTPAVPNAIIRTRHQWVDCVFEASVPGSTVTPRPDEIEIAEAAWHPLENLPPLTVSTARLLAHYGIGPYADYPEARA